jgi:hypothetical protein
MKFTTLGIEQPPWTSIKATKAPICLPGLTTPNNLDKLLHFGRIEVIWGQLVNPYCQILSLCAAVMFSERKHEKHCASQKNQYKHKRSHIEPNQHLRKPNISNMTPRPGAPSNANNRWVRFTLTASCCW